jgi:hypothetical protein
MVEILPLKIPKQSNCWETGATENAVLGEGVFYSRRKHSIGGSAYKEKRQTEREGLEKEER